MRILNYLIFGSVFLVPSVDAEMKTWTDKEGRKYITNVPEECIKSEKGKEFVDSECISRINRTVKPEKTSPKPDKLSPERENDKKEWVELKERNYSLKERLHSLEEEINDRKISRRKFPDDLAIKKSIEIKEAEYKEIQREQQRVLRRIYYLQGKNY